MEDLISARRESVLQSYNSAKAENKLRFLEGDDKATSEYIYPNQIKDANSIVEKFYKNNRRVISVQKKTKVGADGLMIEVAKLLTTHIDDKFVVNPANVRIITGMSNASWEKDIIEKAPSCFKDKIFHHGKLPKALFHNLKNGLIIIDEIDVGDKLEQRLDEILKAADILDVKNMEKHNIRIIVISATIIKQMYQLKKWGDLYESFTMTIPDEYIGHSDFLEMGVIQEFYPLNSKKSADKWIKEDILSYKHDYRVHIVRVTETTNKFIKEACIAHGIEYKNYNSDDRLSDEVINKLFKDKLSHHIVLGVKGFFRRANLIPNNWKLRIGATHEFYSKKVDINVQIQGLPGRMTGYWRKQIEDGHKIGPYRTSVKAIEDYEKSYEDAFGNGSYSTVGFTKKDGRVHIKPTLLSVENIKHLEAVEEVDEVNTVPIVICLTKEAYGKITKVRGSWNIQSILTIIQEHSPDTYKLIHNLPHGRVLQPIDKDTYTRFITDMVEASTSNKKKSWDVADVKKDIYQVYLDKRKYRVIVSIYYGSKSV